LFKVDPPIPMTDIPFELRSTRIDAAVVLTIVGEIDMATAPEVAGAIDAQQDGAGRVVVDLSEVTFLDSSALNVFVHSQQLLAEHNVPFRIVSPADHAVRNIFEITRLTEPLSVVDSLDAALA
jgi:anti-sigma B factor antagonist